MKQIKNMNYKLHVLICVNKRENDPNPCCVDVHGQEIYDDIKKFVKEHGLAGVVWVTRTRYLGFCNNIGATIVFYPERMWLTEVKLNEVPQLKQYILKRIESS